MKFPVAHLFKFGVLAFLGVQGLSIAAQELPQKTLRLGITSQSAPYVYSIEEGSGIDPELLAFISEKMGYKPDFIPVPFNRRTQVLRDGKVDAVTMWSKPDDIACNTSEPYRYWRNALFQVSATSDLPAGPAISDTEKIGIYRGSERLISELAAIGLRHEELQQISSIHSAVRMLLHGRLKAYIGDYPTVIYNLGREDPENKLNFEITRFFSPAPQRLCFTSSDLMVKFNTALRHITMYTPGELAAISRLHGLEASITPPIDTFVADAKKKGRSKRPGLNKR